jgi:hypothetical protein
MIAPVSSMDIRDSCIGVNVFEGITDRDLDLLSASGTKWVKVQFICNLDGQPSFGWRYYDSLVCGLMERGLRVAAQFLRWDLVGDTPGVFEEVAFPPPTRSPSEMRSWLAFVERAVSDYGQYIRQWEIWNEEDIEVFWPPQPDIEEYVRLLEVTSQVIRETSADAEIILGGLCDYEYEPTWIAELDRLGALDLIDIVGVHPDRELPELGLVVYEDDREVRYPYPPIVRQFRTAMGVQADRLRLWDTEVQLSYTTHRRLVKEPQRRTAEVRAKHLLRRFLVEAYLGFEQTFWQLWKAFPYEDHPGQLLDIDGQPTFAYAALTHLCSVVGDRVGAATLAMEAPGLGEAAPDPGEAETLGEKVVLCPLQRSDGTLLASYWLPRAPVLHAPVDTVDITVERRFEEPILVDLLSGLVYAPTQVQTTSNSTRLHSLPLLDRPLVLMERGIGRVEDL